MLARCYSLLELAGNDISLSVFLAMTSQNIFSEKAYSELAKKVSQS